MKNILTFSIVLLLSLSMQSQDYIPFPDSVATWNVYQTGFNFTDGSSINGSRAVNFHIEGDTLVNDTAYCKIFVRLSYYNLDSPESYSEGTNPYMFIGGIREDSSKKVLFRNMNFDDWDYSSWPVHYFSMNSLGDTETTPLTDSVDESNEVMLYDFGLQVGDSMFFPGDLELFGGYWGVVEEVSIDVLGRNTIRFNYPEECWEEECGRIWVEGLGDLRSHPFSLFDTNEIIGLGWGYSNNLNCFWENGEQVYVNTDIGGDFLDNCENLNVGIYEIEKRSLEIYPNPSSGLFSITLPNFKSSSLTIFNAFGSEVYHQRKIIGDQFTFDLTHFTKGIYMVLLETEMGSFSGKVVRE